MTIQQLRYVTVICDEGSLNKASEQLYIAQPSLTSALQELGKEIGITIFNRSGRGVTPTNDGLEFIRYAREVLSQYDILLEKYGKLGNLIDNNMKKPKEYVDTGLRYPLQLVKFKRDILTSNLHPTQKPLALMEWLVRTFTNEDNLVLDFTMGSGTTGLACKNLNRNFIGIENDENYFNIAKNRIYGITDNG